MRAPILGSVLFMMTVPIGLVAQTADDPVAIALAQGACAPFGVASAERAADGTIRAVCNADATAFVPLLGGLGPLIGAGAALAVASAVSGGNATPNTR